MHQAYSNTLYLFSTECEFPKVIDHKQAYLFTVVKCSEQFQGSRLRESHEIAGYSIWRRQNFSMMFKRG